MFQICSWNVRGLNDLTKRALVKSVVSGLKVSVLCFQETKVCSFSRSFLLSLAGQGFDKCHFIPSVGASGGLVTCWSSKHFTCSEVIVRDHSLTLRLSCALRGSSFYLTNVYGPPTWDGKDEFCRELIALKSVCPGPWAICGDFNLTRSLAERQGRRWCNRLMTMFSAMINELELVDLPMLNQSFTWSNMQSPPTLAKLDRFLISTDWDLAFPLSSVAALPRITSDHSPILLKTQRNLAPYPFRFEKVWLTRSDFISLVPIWWQEIEAKQGRQGSILTFTARLRHCRKRIKEWRSSNFYNICATKRATSEEI